MAEGSVRPASPDDAAAVGAVQSRSWRQAYATVLPETVLAALDADALAAPWRAAVVSPPTPQHHLFVACAGSLVVGFTAFGPAQDADLDKRLDAELYALVIDPAAQHGGHGSRLLAATVDVLRADGFTTVSTWLASTDDDLRGFLRSSGWDADGAHRTLDLYGDGQVVVSQVRLHTDIKLLSDIELDTDIGEAR